MAEDFADWLVSLATQGDQTVLDRLPGYLHDHFAQLRGDPEAISKERQRVAREFSERAPNTSLTKDMLAIIQG